MKIIFRLIFIISVTIVLSSCSSSSEYQETKTENSATNDNTSTETYSEENGSRILYQAKIEQQNRMYSPSVDSTFYTGSAIS